MPDSIGADGLTVDSAAETTQFLLNGDDELPGLNQIYGADINVDQNTSDGQEVGLITQIGTDLRELLLGINSGFDPDQAQGIILDQRAAINNIQREGGTYTIQPVSITSNTTVALQGLDANFNDPNGTGYTVQDNSGNLFILETSTTLTPGTTVCNFRAALIGDVQVPIDTIINPVTIILGITAVNNPSAAITVGQNQETDPQLRVRRQQSVALATTGFANGLEGKIKNLPGVTEARLLQNNGGSTDGNGTPGHTMWLIVAGGSSADIANTIYNSINGAGMRGAVTYDITQPAGTIFTVRWDTPIAERLYLKFTIQTTIPGSSFNIAAIQNAIADGLSYGIGSYAETSAPTIQAAAAITNTGGGGAAVLMQISTDNVTYTDYVTTIDPQHQFTVAAADIAITVV